MNIDEMNLQEVETRLSALSNEVAKTTDIEFVRLAKVEKTNLLERKAELEKLEQRKADIALIENGAGGILEKRNGEFKMIKTYEVDSVEYRNAWLRDLQGRELNVEERTAITASGLMPTITLNKIVEKIEQTSALYSRITVLNIPGNVSIPVESADNDASWVAMGTASSDGADDFDTVNLAAYKLIKTIEITADVSAMSIEAFEQFIVDSLYKKIMKAVEKAIIAGTGNGQPTGLMADGVITNTGTFTYEGVTLEDIGTQIAALATGYDPVWILPRALFYKEILAMQTASGDKVVVEDVQSPAKFNLFGYPVIVDDYATADRILFGDLSYYFFNWAKDIEVRADGSVGFRTGSTVYRAFALADGKLTVADAFTCFKRADAPVVEDVDA